MKSTKEFRPRMADAGDDLLRKPAKLEPVKKSGKERHSLYGDLDDEDDLELLSYKKRESVLDYFDDGIDPEQEDYEDEQQDDGQGGGA